MKLSASKKDLQEVLSQVVAVSNPRSPYPGHTYLFIQVTGPVTTFTCSNDKAILKVKLECGLQDGPVAVSAAKILQMVKQFPDGPVEFLSHTGNLFLSSPVTSLKYKLPTVVAEPPVGDSSGSNVKNTVQSKHLLQVVEAVAHAIDPGTKFPGVRLELRRDGLTAMATDGRRLACSTIKGNYERCDAMLPVEAVATIRKGLSNGGTVTVEVGTSLFHLHADSAEYTCSLLPPDFPDLRQFRPPVASEHAVSFPKEATVTALRSVAQVCTETSPGVILSFAEGTCLLNSESADIGGSGVEVPVEFQGKKPSLGCNPKYLADACMSIPTSDLVMVIRSELDPVLVEPLGDNGGQDTWCVVMPMRI